MSMPQATSPAVVSQAQVEDFVWGIDCTVLLVSPAVPTDVTVTLTTPNNKPVSLTDSPTVVGNVITQRIRAGTLQPTGAQTYTLLATFTPTGGSDVYAEVLAIRCPF